MHVFFSIKEQYNASARVPVYFPPNAKDKHTLKQKTHLQMVRRAEKRIQHLAFAFTGASLGHLCVYVDMGGYVKFEMGL